MSWNYIEIGSQLYAVDEFSNEQIPINFETQYPYTDTVPSLPGEEWIITALNYYFAYLRLVRDQADCDALELEDINLYYDLYPDLNPVSYLYAAEQQDYIDDNWPQDDAAKQTLVDLVHAAGVY
ncbi:hypothetical protein [Nostoc sp.]|uniref:hypothetical protein n=1 Tax=Nostoc sp. TaxID=1180 RepID=UPI002FF985C6